MNSVGINVQTSGTPNGIKSGKNQPIIKQLGASIQTKMAAHFPHLNGSQDVENIKNTAHDLAQDIVHYVTQNKSNILVSEHAKTMRRTVDEMRTRHEILFNSMVAKLEIQFGKDLEATIIAVADEMFSDSRYNWGRVVSVYAFGAHLAKHCNDRGYTDSVDQIGQYVGNYVCEKLSFWIHKQGGWSAFDEYFPDVNSFEDKLWKGLLFTAFGLGALATMVAVR